jgi:isopentenyl phosphate kinase
MPYVYALAEHGRTLATRPLGEMLREDLIEKAAGEEMVELNFTDVLGASHSFADEFVARLAEEAESDKVPFEVTLAGASDDVQRVIRRALDRRALSLPQPA